MNTILPIILLAILVVALVPLAMCAGKYLGRRVAANSLTHPDGQISLKAEEVIATRYLLGKFGTTSAQVLIADAGERPIGIIEDTADSADVSATRPVAVALLGATKGTKRMISAGVIPADVDVYSVGGGKVDILADAAEDDWLVGRSVTAATAADQEIVVIPVLPVDQKPGA